jgi:hypothetical protein
MSPFRNITYRKPLIPNLGQVVSPIIQAARAYEDSCLAISEDMQAFHAPSECGKIAYNGAYRRLEEAISEAVVQSGVSRQDLVEEIHARIGGRWWNWTSYSLGLPSNLEMGD